MKEKNRRLEKAPQIKEYNKKRNAIRRKDPEYKAKWKILYKKWIDKNREKVNRKRREKYVSVFVRKTPEELSIKARLRNRSYYLRHRERVMRSTVAIHKRRMKTDVGYRIKNLMRTRLWKAVKGVSKHKETMMLLGCSIEELKSHLEQQFMPGMNWTNYGKGGWVIDHVIPLALFNLEDQSSLEKAAHYLNLQPMWELENLKKGHKIC